MKEKVQTFKENIAEMISIVQQLDEETIRWQPTEEEWSIMQIIVHVGEAIPYWLQEIDQIIKNPNEKWGRGLSDEKRLYAVSEENVEKTSVEAAVDQLEKVKSPVEIALFALTEEQLALVAPSHNPNFADKPVQFIVDKLIIGHVAGHLGQIKRNLSKRNQ